MKVMNCLPSLCCSYYPTGLGVSYFHFPLILEIFLFFPFFFKGYNWVGCCLTFMSPWVLWDFSHYWFVVLLYCDQQSTRNHFNFHLFVKTGFVPEGTIYFRESFMGCLEECVFCSVWMEYSVMSNTFNLWCHLFQVFV